MSHLWSDGHSFTANMLWCEEKYAYSAVIAEFWNAMTNIPFVLIGVCYMRNAIRLGLPKRYWLCYAFLTLIGIGSFLFHSTLRYEAQLLDELPMMLLAGQCIWCMIVNGRSSMRKKIIAAIGVYGLIAVGTAIYLRFNNYWVFHGLFATIMSLVILGAVKLSWSNSRTSKLMTKAFWYTLTAFGLWNIDMHFCKPLRFARTMVGFPLNSLLQLHAWWHLLTAIGLVWFVTGLIAAHPLGKRCRIIMRPWMPPLLERARQSKSKGPKVELASR